MNVRIKFRVSDVRAKCTGKSDKGKMKTDKDNIAMTAQEWDHEYQNGFEDKLLRDNERKRYEAIADRIKAEGGDTGILDLGCGTGELVKYLTGIISYIGVDFSEIAIETARKLHREENYSFVCEDIDKYTPTDKMGVIVFNESLYYLDDPIRTLGRYMSFLSPDGLMLISIHCPPKEWDSVEPLARLYDEVVMFFANKAEITDIRDERRHWKLLSIVKDRNIPG